MSDVKIEVSRKGDDETFPAVGDTVVIHYTGTLVEGGTKFDSSVDRGSPFETEIGVGRVIQGWDEAIPKLSKGSKAVITIPSAKAYGGRGAPPVIPPHAALKFEVELLDVRRQGDSSWCSVM